MHFVNWPYNQIYLWHESSPFVRIFEPSIRFKSDLLNYSISRTCFYSQSKFVHSCLDMIGAFISKPYDPDENQTSILLIINKVSLPRMEIQWKVTKKTQNERDTIGVLENTTLPMVYQRTPPSQRLQFSPNPTLGLSLSIYTLLYSFLHILLTQYQCNTENTP